MPSILLFAPRFFRPSNGPTRCLAWDPRLKSVKRVKVSPCHFSLSSNFISRIWQSLASLVHTPPCILPKLTFFRNRSQGSFLFDIVRKLCGLLMIDSSDGFISSIFDKCSMLLQTIWPSNHTSHIKVYLNEFVANALRDNIG